MDTSPMPGECSVAGCKGRDDLHSFPESEREKRSWSDFCKRDIVNFETARVCGRHFRDSDYEAMASPPKKLKKGSQPTQQPPGMKGKPATEKCSIEEFQRQLKRLKKEKNILLKRNRLWAKEMKEARRQMSDLRYHNELMAKERDKARKERDALQLEKRHLLKALDEERKEKEALVARKKQEGAELHEAVTESSEIPDCPSMETPTVNVIIVKKENEISHTQNHNEEMKDVESEDTDIEPKNEEEITIKEEEIECNDPLLTFPCKFCETVYTTKYDLENHIKEVHERGDLLSCCSCEKMFHKDIELKLHEVVQHQAKLCKKEMARKYVNKGQRAQWSLESMKMAAAAVLDRGLSVKQAAKNYNVPRTTLRRHLEKGGSIKKQLGRRTILTEGQENELKTLILDMESRLFGLTLNDIRKLVYQFCEMRKIKHPFNEENRLAGKDWADAFMKRHPDISLRVPEPTSIARAIGFNRTKVEKFFQKYKSIVFKDDRKVIPDTNIYNEDESGYTTVHDPPKILAKKGKRTVGTLTSAEKGKTITTACCMSATGHFVPPLLVFPRVRMRDELLDDAIPGAIGRGNPSGWINEDIFVDWFDHFLHHVQPKSRPEPTLLILDGHNTHTKNLAVIEKARENNVVMLSLPSHCTHKLQPLDRTFFKSLNSAYDSEVHLWLRNHPGRALSETLVPKLLRAAYSKAATLDIASNGFRKCGLVPYNPNIFTDEDFRAADMSAFEPDNQTVETTNTGDEAHDETTAVNEVPTETSASPNVQMARPGVEPSDQSAKIGEAGEHSEDQTPHNSAFYLESGAA